MDSYDFAVDARMQIQTIKIKDGNCLDSSTQIVQKIIRSKNAVLQSAFFMIEDLGFAFCML